LFVVVGFELLLFEHEVMPAPTNSKQINKLKFNFFILLGLIYELLLK